MIRKHQVHRASFQPKAALSAVPVEVTPIELSLRFGVNPAQVSQWKHQLEKTAQRVFSGEEAERKPIPQETELLAALERMQA